MNEHAMSKMELIRALELERLKVRQVISCVTHELWADSSNRVARKCLLLASGDCEETKNPINVRD